MGVPAPLCVQVGWASRTLAETPWPPLDPPSPPAGLGIANLAGAMWSCYTTTGSFSRSAVNNSVG